MDKSSQFFLLQMEKAHFKVKILFHHLTCIVTSFILFKILNNLVSHGRYMFKFLIF